MRPRWRAYGTSCRTPSPSSSRRCCPARTGRLDKPLLDIHANVYIERPSQKGIIIGPKGKRLKDVGIKSRKHIEALLGTPVFLDLHVKVAKDWQRDPKQLRKLGF